MEDIVRLGTHFSCCLASELTAAFIVTTKMGTEFAEKTPM